MAFRAKDKVAAIATKAIKFPGGAHSFTLSPGERVGVRASVNH